MFASSMRDKERVLGKGLEMRKARIQRHTLLRAQKAFPILLLLLDFLFSKVARKVI